MSRAVLALVLLLFLSPAVHAQMRQNEDVASFVERRSAEILNTERPEKKCPEPVEGEEIVVCAVVDSGADQQIFERPPEQSSSSKNAAAAACIPGTGCQQPLTGGRSFGSRRPPAIPIEEVYAGLPEPEDVVPEGSGEPD
jgi:hypothetical protein